MSRTRRRIPADPRRVSGNNPYPIDKHGFQTVPDGKTSWSLLIFRDSRCTGLREHRLHRRLARQELRCLAAEADPIAGKTRRYNVKREMYLL